ncbi:MAG: DUF1919 domain-containing protein [Lachnospiraceae bacterium]|nr:DUF1919 domain-containing protein [Lachnospiraceae bacterium]
MYNILIWGTAMEYDQYLAVIKYYEGKKLFQVVGVTSNDNYYNYLDGYPFIPKRDLVKVAYDWIIICASKERTADIRKEAISMGISEDILFSAYILLQPEFDFEKYIRLSESKISIFSCNCWGGQAYKRFGLKVRSPFYNMYEHVSEFIPFLKDAKEILSSEKLQFCTTEYNDDLLFHYPVYDLAGLKLHMNNYPNPEEAERKWYERCARINWDNVFVMIYADDVRCIEDFSRLPYQKKICFTTKETDIPNTCCLPIEKVCPDRKFGQIVIGSVIGRYKLYDVMELLLSGRIVKDCRIG